MEIVLKHLFVFIVLPIALYWTINELIDLIFNRDK